MMTIQTYPKNFANLNVPEPPRGAILANLADVEAEIAELREKREHTWKWYARRYGKLHDWARKILPEPWSAQFFSCIANGTYSATEDVGEPYICALGKVVPPGYFVMDTASEQLLYEQTRRAEDAETALAAANRKIGEQEQLLNRCREDINRMQQKYEPFAVLKDGIWPDDESLNAPSEKESKDTYVQMQIIDSYDGHMVWDGDAALEAKEKGPAPLKD